MRYHIGAGPIQTTAAFVPMATSAAIKTLLQLKPRIPLKIVEWGISFDGFVAALPGKVELIETTVAATSLTAFVNADFTKLDATAMALGDPTSLIVEVGTSASGYNSGSSAEGSITTLRNLDAPQFIAPTNQFIKQFPLGREPILQHGQYARIRVTFGTTVNAYPYLIVET